MESVLSGFEPVRAGGNSRIMDYLLQAWMYQRAEWITRDRKLERAIPVSCCAFLNPILQPNPKSRALQRCLFYGMNRSLNLSNHKWSLDLYVFQCRRLHLRVRSLLRMKLNAGPIGQCHRQDTSENP